MVLTSLYIYSKYIIYVVVIRENNYACVIPIIMLYLQCIILLYSYSCTKYTVNKYIIHKYMFFEKAEGTKSQTSACLLTYCMLQ